MPTNMPAESEELKAPLAPSGPASLKPGQVLVLAACIAVVLTIYVWFVSWGTWTQWQTDSQTRSHYYDQLAASFLKGKLSLDITPDPALLALPNPYDRSALAEIPYPLDTSFYAGKFYLYFGPVPALLLMAPKAIFHGEIGDQYVVFTFVCGILLIQSLLIIKLWKRFFPALPLWIVAGSLLLAGLAPPLNWILGKTAIYEAALTGGQFFFLAGLYSAIDALDRASVSRWKLALTGLLWSAAIGSRITLLLPIGLMTFMILVAVIRTQDRSDLFSKVIPAMTSLGLVLGLGLGCLGWYNLARFGSIFETGLRYQLGPENNGHWQELFSPGYVVQNLYNYTVYPPKVQPGFPYLFALAGRKKPVLTFVATPDFYQTQKMTGIIPSAPFTVLGIVPAIAMLRKRSRPLARDEDRRFFQWIVAGLYGSFLSIFAIYIGYYWAAERFFADFFPCLIMLSIIGFWQLASHFPQRSLSRVLVLVGATSLLGVSIISSNLLAMSNRAVIYRYQLHPEFWSQLLSLFRR